MPEQADTLYRQLDELDELRSLYLHMLTWGLPEYEKLDQEERERFSELVKSGTLFAYVETQKRTVLATGLDVPVRIFYKVDDENG